MDIELDGTVAVGGDTHGHIVWLQHCLEWARERDAVAYLHAGDLGHYRRGDLDALDEALHRLGMDFYWWEGNHDNHDLLKREPTDALSLTITSERTRRLPRGYVLGVNGQRAMALGGASSVNRDLLVEGHEWWPDEVVTEVDVAVATTQSADILFTHECPAGFDVVTRHVDALNARHAHSKRRWSDERLAESDTQRERLARVMQAIGARTVVHGHHHLDYVEYNDHLDAVAVGLAKEYTSFERHIALLQPWQQLEFIGEVVDL